MFIVILLPRFLADPIYINRILGTQLDLWSYEGQWAELFPSWPGPDKKPPFPLWALKPGKLSHDSINQSRTMDCSVCVSKIQTGPRNMGFFFSIMKDKV